MKTLPTVRHYPITDYTTIWQSMRHFTNTRTPETTDEIWCVELFKPIVEGR